LLLLVTAGRGVMGVIGTAGRIARCKCAELPMSFPKPAGMLATVAFRAGLVGVYRMTPHNWHNFLRCHGHAAAHRHSAERR
jgi:hypothetical protein